MRATKLQQEIAYLERRLAELDGAIPVTRSGFEYAQALMDRLEDRLQALQETLAAEALAGDKS